MIDDIWSWNWSTYLIQDGSFHGLYWEFGGFCAGGQANWQKMMRNDVKWREMMQNDAKWWEMMRNDMKWREMMWNDVKWREQQMVTRQQVVT